MLVVKYFIETCAELPFAAVDVFWCNVNGQD